MNETVVRMEGITKAFAGIKALDNVHFELRKGEVHALMGENGAGKSTLMKILTGVHQKDEGKIFIQNNDNNLKEVEIKNPLMSQHLGVSMVFQELNLLENMNIAENIYLGREPINPVTRTVDKKILYKKAKEQLQKVKLNIDPGTPIKNLSTAQKQSVEIAKCLSFDAKVIILDEPTASLTENESQILFNIIRELKNKGISIIYISHRMEEIFELSDRMTVFRDGKCIKTLIARETTENELVKLMIGRELEESNQNRTGIRHENKVIFEAKNIKVFPTASPVSFKLHEKEILGFFGLVGAGRTEIARTIFGIDPIGEGEIYIEGNKIKISSPKEAIKAGIGLVPEDRKDLGLILGMSVKDNMIISKLTQLKSEILKEKDLKGLTESYIEKFSIALANEDQQVKELSGGNQQKVVIAKWLAMSPKILILDEPTRGIDVGAKSEIYTLMQNLVKEGMSIIMISSELAEILKVSDRVAVMYEGSKTGELLIEEATQEKIMHLAIGG